MYEYFLFDIENKMFNIDGDYENFEEGILKWGEEIYWEIDIFINEMKDNC